MNNKVCRLCGSSYLISDRSLGGKIICGKCGSSTFKDVAVLKFKKIYLLYFSIGLIAFLIVTL